MEPKGGETRMVEKQLSQLSEKDKPALAFIVWKYWPLLQEVGPCQTAATKNFVG